MALTGNSNPALVEGIISSFRDTPVRSLQTLSEFTTRDWRRTEIWLNTSGLALYFLDRLQSAGLSQAIDTSALRLLEQNLAENQIRTADMLREFVAINQTFRDAGMSYANLKGFTLAPASCHDLSLRRLSDHDFLIDPVHINVGRKLIEERGYVLTASSPRTLEFKSGSSQATSFDGFYRTTPVRAVELHVAMGSVPLGDDPAVRDKRLDRLVGWTCEGGTFPALGSTDQLIGQALHLLSHLLSEHSRLSWILEFRNHVIARQHERHFWADVRSLAATNLEAGIALGVSIMLATEIFGPFSFPELDSWTVDILSPTIKLWIATYGRRAVLAEVPGTKLYLLLEGVLGLKPPARLRRDLKARLLPSRGPSCILLPPPRDTIPLRVRREITQLRYFAYRLRFHLKQGAVYLVEAARWEKLVKESGLAQPSLAATRELDPSPDCEKITR
jgi:hypothetical protein